MARHPHVVNRLCLSIASELFKFETLYIIKFSLPMSPKGQLPSSDANLDLMFDEPMTSC